MSVQLGEYMTATDITPPSRKTKLWRINDRHGGVLGSVEWYGAWRQYVFCPEGSSAAIFNGGCLDQITAFMRTEMAERAADRAHERSSGARQGGPK